MPSATSAEGIFKTKSDNEVKIMKKIFAIIVAVVLIAAAGISGFIFYHGEDGAYSRTVTQTFTLSENSLTQWKFETDKNVRAHIKIEIEGATLKDTTQAQLLVKGPSSTSSKKIDAEKLSKRETVSTSLLFRKGSSNYILFTPVSCDSVRIKVTVSTNSLKGHLKAAGVEYGKDYGL